MEIIPGQQKGLVGEQEMNSTFIPPLFSVLPNARKREKDSHRGKAGYSKLREVFFFLSFFEILFIFS